MPASGTSTGVVPAGGLGRGVALGAGSRLEMAEAAGEAVAAGGLEGNVGGVASTVDVGDGDDEQAASPMPAAARLAASATRREGALRDVMAPG
jgi:hypothetical protein